MLVQDDFSISSLLAAGKPDGTFGFDVIIIRYKYFVPNGTKTFYNFLILHESSLVFNISRNV
jgi:hypothetical protein